MQINSPIAITGLGIVSSIGTNIAEFTSSLKGSVSGIQYHHEVALSPEHLNIAAIVSQDDLKRALSAINPWHEPQQSLIDKALLSSEKVPVAAIIAALQAVNQAGIYERGIDSYRVALIIAGSNTSSHYQYKTHERYKDKLNVTSPNYARTYLDTNLVGVLSEVIGSKGISFTIGGASASSHLAVFQGMRLLQQDLCDCCVVVGALADLSPLEIHSFNNIGALGGHSYVDNPKEACRPFDLKHEGFIRGEASAAIVLEKNNDVNAQAWLLGASICTDANSGTNPNLEGEIRAVQMALDEAKLTHSDIDYINTHGSSSVLGDEIEATAISSVFTDGPWVNATKSLTGHCLWSSGLVELIATVIQVQHGFLHGNINLTHPIDKNINFISKLGCSSVDLTHALANNYGFAGINSSIVIKKGFEDRLRD